MPTLEIPNDEGHYVVLLDIFHSLHCLNEIRKSLHPAYYGFLSFLHCLLFLRVMDKSMSMLLDREGKGANKEKMRAI